MTRTNKLSVALLLLALTGPGSAADLIDVFRIAQSSDATYASARASWAATQERIPQARAGLLPNASVSGSAQYVDRSIRFRDAAIHVQRAASRLQNTVFA